MSMHDIRALVFEQSGHLSSFSRRVDASRACRNPFREVGTNIAAASVYYADVDAATGKKAHESVGRCVFAAEIAIPIVDLDDFHSLLEMLTCRQRTGCNLHSDDPSRSREMAPTFRSLSARPALFLGGF